MADLCNARPIVDRQLKEILKFQITKLQKLFMECYPPPIFLIWACDKIPGFLLGEFL